MPALKPFPWPIDPLATEAPDLWRDALVVPLMERAGSIARAFGGKEGTINGVPWVVARLGAALDFNSSQSSNHRIAFPNAQVSALVNKSNASLGGSFLAVAGFDSVGDNLRGRLLELGSRGAAGPFTWETNNTDTANALVLDVCRSDGTRNTSTGVANLLSLDGTVHTYGTVFRSRQTHHWKDGMYAGAGGSVAVDPTKTLTQNAYISTRGDQYYGIDGRVLMVVFWPYALPDGTMARLTTDPFTLIRERRRVWTVSGGGGGGGGGGFQPVWAARSNVLLQPGIAA